MIWPEGVFLVPTRATLHSLTAGKPGQMYIVFDRIAKEFFTRATSLYPPNGYDFGELRSNYITIVIGDSLGGIPSGIGKTIETSVTTVTGTGQEPIEAPFYYVPKYDPEGITYVVDAYCFSQNHNTGQAKGYFCDWGCHYRGQAYFATLSLLRVLEACQAHDGLPF